jgi:hypothetical protein
MTRTPRRRLIVLVVVLAAAGLIALFAAVGLLSRSSLGGGSGGGSSADSSYGRSLAAAPEAASNDAAQSSKAEGAVAGGGTAQTDVALAVPPASAYSAHHLIRTGDISILIAKGTLLSSVDRVTSMTTASGGYVLSSAIGSDAGTPVPLTEGSGDVMPAGGVATSTLADGSSPYATLTVRVPERVFDSTLKRLAQLGKVESVSTSSEDVTSQYVDMQARLRHQRAVEARLVSFLDKADTISETLAVQDRIDNVELQIEELSAQLKSLRETTTYGTISVDLHEKQAAVVVASSNSFSDTLWHSLALLGHGARVTGLVLTALLPFVLVFGVIGVAVWYVVRRTRRARRRTAQPTLPA